MKWVVVGFVLSFVLLSVSASAQIAQIPNFGSYPQYGDDFLYLAEGGYVSLPDSNVSDIDYTTTSFSVEAIADIRRFITGGPHSGFLSKTGHLWDEDDAGWGLGLSNNDIPANSYSLEAKVSDGTNQIRLGKYVNGVHHVIMTWDVSTRTLELFVDGISVNSGNNTAINPENLSTSDDLMIGKCTNTPELKRNILMARWWGRKLSNDEIAALADNWLNDGDDRVPAGVSRNNLISEWLMNEECVSDGNPGTGYIKDFAGSNHLQLIGNSELKISEGETLTLISPYDGATDINKSVTLKASGGDADIGGATHPLFYLFQVDTFNTFDSPNLKESGWIPHYSEYTPLLNPSMQYYWRVKVKDVNGAESSYTPIWSFTTEPASTWYVRPAGGDYGNEDGSSYANAWDGLTNIIWGENGVEAGDTLYICGLHLRTRYGGSAWERVTPQASGGGEGSRITIRGDCPGDQGIIWGAGIMEHEPWVDEGENVWSITMHATPNDVWFFEDITSDSWTVLNKVDSLADCRATPGSYYSSDYAAGSKFYVHTSDSSNPTGKIAANRLGYHVYVNDDHYITWANLKFYGIHRWIDYSSAPYGFVTHMTWENCTIWYGEFIHFLFRNNNHHMEFINCDIAWAKNGFGFAESPIGSGSGPDGDGSEPHHYVIRRCKIHHIGVWRGDSDAHAIGGQGSRDGLIEYNELYNTGTGVTFYNYNERQSIKNTTVRYNWIHDTHTNGGANSRGIEFNTGPAEYNTTNTRCYGNIVGPNVSDVCYRFKWEDMGEFYNNIAIGCSMSYYISHHLHSINVKLKNCISLNPTMHHIKFATNVNYSGQYSIDSDYNLFYPDGQGLFYFADASGSSGYDFAGWQSLVRSGSTFDPHSLTLDPMFLNPSNNNFHLHQDSPAIDNGTDVGLTKDYDGNPIPQGTGFDIGAFEYLSGFILPGDLNRDGYVDIYDLIFITPHFGKRYPHPEWNVTADAVPDNEIDIYDVVFVASRFT